MKSIYHAMTSRLNSIALPLSMLGLSACTSLAPTYQPPKLPVAAEYPVYPVSTSAPSIVQAAQNNQLLTLGDLNEAGWRGYFSDPQLQGLIEHALRNNRDVRLAVTRVLEAQAAYGIQRGEQLPNLGAQFGADRSRVPGDLNLTRRPLVASQYQLGLGINAWELDFWGRLQNLNDAALETLLATDEARRAVSLTLVAQVADAYYSLAELNERRWLAQRTLESRAESYRIFSRRTAVGSTSKFNLIQIETLLNQAQTLLAQLEQARAANVHALTLLLGEELDQDMGQVMLKSLSHLPSLSAGTPSQLLQSHPAIIAAEHRLKAAHANIGAARAAFFPRIVLTGSFGTASAELDGLFAAGSRAWTFAPSISLPIFEGGRLRNNLNLTEVRRDAAVASYEKAIQSAFRDVSDALSARHWLSQQLGIAETTLAAQKERARLSQLRYDNGASAFLDVLDAQRDLLTAEQQLVQTKRALQSSSISLYAALGGAVGDFSSTSADLKSDLQDVSPSTSSRSLSGN